jgi:uncharacterized circularly permuted ATP-grasp superfamily protein
MLTIQRVMKRNFPQFFCDYGVRPIEHYTQLLLKTLRFLAPEGRQTRWPSDRTHLARRGIFNACRAGNVTLGRSDPQQC